MRRSALPILLLVAALSGCRSAASLDAGGPPSPGAGDSPLAAAAWLAGAWAGVSTADGQPVRVEEVWTAPRGGTMLGMNRTIAGDRTVFFEHLRLEASTEGVVYLASPRGRQPPTPFTLIESSPQRLVFENPEHDFPQRIVYIRDGDDGMTAQIEGAQNGARRVETWRYDRVELR